MAHLVLAKQPGDRHLQTGDTFPLVAGRTIIGRVAFDPLGPSIRPEWIQSEEGFIGLSSPAAARRHAAVFRTAAGYAVQHLRSRSYVSVNNKNCPGDDLVSLADGDVIRICDYFFAFRVDDPPVPQSDNVPASGYTSQESG